MRNKEIDKKKIKNEKEQEIIPQKNIIKNNIRVIIFALTLIVFLLIVEDIFENDIYKFDNLVYKYVSKIINPQITTFARIFTNVGAAYAIIPICVIMFIVLKDKMEAFFITLNIAIVVPINFILKNIFVRPRPTEFRLANASGYSFPSGHSMASMAFYGFLIYLILKNVKNKAIKWSISIFLSVIIILIGVSRIYLGVHYASDVLGGFLLAVAYLTIFTKYYKEYQEDKIVTQKTVVVGK